MCGLLDVTCPFFTPKCHLQDMEIKIHERHVALPAGDIHEPPAGKEADYYRQFESDKHETHVYDLRAPSQLVVMYLVYFVPLLVVGIAGWITQNWHVSSYQGMNSPAVNSSPAKRLTSPA